MYYDRDEFLLFSRGGRVPPAVRAGPPRAQPELPPPEPWLLQMARAAVAGMLRRDRHQDARLDRDAYLELEFAVGFAADDDLAR